MTLIRKAVASIFVISGCGILALLLTIKPSIVSLLLFLAAWLTISNGLEMFDGPKS